MVNRILSADPAQIKSAQSIIILCVVAAAFPCFFAWSHYQVKRGKPALIPNKLWRNSSFSSICATVALSFAVINSMELFVSLLYVPFSIIQNSTLTNSSFQEVQHLSALQASIRILPSLVVGALVNAIMGFFVHKVPAPWIVSVTSILCAGAPLLMAVIQPHWPYWGNAFVAQLLQPISVDALFTVGLIMITDIFPDNTQAVAGAVFNTSAQFGSALGLAVLQVISTITTDKASHKAETSALMDGYRASFWAMFGFMMLCAVIGFFGLRKTGRIGLKLD